MVWLTWDLLAEPVLVAEVTPPWLDDLTDDTPLLLLRDCVLLELSIGFLLILPYVPLLTDAILPAEKWKKKAPWLKTNDICETKYYSYVCAMHTSIYLICE